MATTTSKVDYANLATPPVCVADFCLIPVSSLFFYCTPPCAPPWGVQHMLYEGGRHGGLIGNDESGMGIQEMDTKWSWYWWSISRLVHRPLQFPTRSLLCRGLWRRLDWVIQCIVLGRLLVRPPRPSPLSNLHFLGRVIWRRVWRRVWRRGLRWWGWGWMVGGALLIDGLTDIGV